MVHSTKILVVDDDRDITGMISKVLSRHGFTVLRAHNLTTARAAVSDYQAKFDLILLDVTIDAQGDGIAFLSEIRKKLNLICPVMMISGAFDIDLARKATESGALGYLPASHHEIVQAVFRNAKTSGPSYK